MLRWFVAKFIGNFVLEEWLTMASVMGHGPWVVASGKSTMYKRCGDINHWLSETSYIMLYHAISMNNISI